MADVDTRTRLKVADLTPMDAGRSIARLPTGLMQEMGLAEGDVIEITGKRTTAAGAKIPKVADHSLEFLSMTFTLYEP